MILMDVQMPVTVCITIIFPELPETWRAIQ